MWKLEEKGKPVLVGITQEGMLWSPNEVLAHSAPQLSHLAPHADLKLLSAAILPAPRFSSHRKPLH